MAYDFSKKSVLIVDDILPMCKLLENTLDLLGFETVYTALDAEKGFDLFCRKSPDVILADWAMAPVSGIELTRKIRLDKRSPNRYAPVIIMTGYSSALRVAEARDAGVHEFLLKPFSATDLAKRLAYVFSNPRVFIDSDSYCGPDRRRRADPGYRGPFRRSLDNKKSIA